MKKSKTTRAVRTAPPPCSARRKFRVWFEQVNQACVDVVATDEGAAIDAGVRKWKRENLPPRPAYVAELPNSKGEPRSPERKP